ncbi:MAG: hypothetical protein ACYC7A_21785 [Thermoanaerobaculia bacterium]
MPTKKKAEHNARLALLDLLGAIDEVRLSGRSLPKVEWVIEHETDEMQRAEHRLLGLLDTDGETEH